MRFRPYRVVGALVACFLMGADLAAAQSVEEFYRGRTVTILIPTAPGGDRGANTIPFATHFGKHIPGKPTVVISYKGGAGGAVGMNHLYNVAPRDGTWIGTPLAAFIIGQVTGDKSAKYDVAKMHWVGRTADNNQIIYAWHTTGVTDINGAKQKELTLGSSGVNSASTILPLNLNQALGTRFKIIQGYSGSAQFNLAVERGETDASLTTWNNMRSNYMAWVKDGRAKILVQIALRRHPELSGIPTAAELADNPDDKALIEFASSSADFGQCFVLPPDVPADRVEALRRAFNATMKDPEYIAAIEKLKIDLNPMTGDELTGLATKTLAVPKPVIARYQKAVLPR